jgi:hypothetical protein
MEPSKIYFFGWKNIKKFISEILKIYSTEPSKFSKKRIESGIAFVIAQWGMIFFIIKNIGSMDTSDLVMWASVEFAISGYILNHIQKEKKPSQDESDELTQ